MTGDEHNNLVTLRRRTGDLFSVVHFSTNRLWITLLYPLLENGTVTKRIREKLVPFSGILLSPHDGSLLVETSCH